MKLSEMLWRVWLPFRDRKRQNHGFPIVSDTVLQQHGRMRRFRWALVLALAAPALAGELKPQTSQAFDRYSAGTEQRLNRRDKFLWADESAERSRRARQGEIVVEPFDGKAIRDVPDGLVHDWVGTVFIPGSSLERTLAFVQNYDRHKDFYKPEVIDSRLLSRRDNDFRIFLRLLKKEVITVVLNTEHEVHYTPVDKTRWSSVSRTTRISEVDNAGKPTEKELPNGTGNGFLWRLNSFWRFEERDGGTWVECEAVSLTRDIPFGLSLIIKPIIRSLPKDSLLNTLRATRAGLVK
jgi:hypothetical protein